MKQYIHKQVAPLKEFVKGSERTIPVGTHGDKAVIARLAHGKHKGKTRIQAILQNKFVHQR